MNEKDIYNYLEKMKSEIRLNGYSESSEELIRTYIGIYQLQLIDEMNKKGKVYVD